MIIRTIIKKDGKWIKDPVETEMLSKYLRHQPDGTEVVVTYEVKDDPKTNNQLRLIHFYIDEICNHVGEKHETIKDIIKYKLKLYDEDGELKSFKDYTKKELSQAILETISLADFLDVMLPIYDA